MRPRIPAEAVALNVITSRAFDVVMEEYDAVVVGTGSAMNVVEALIQDNPKVKVAVIDKDEPGGICLTRGCIPSKIMLYPAEVLRTIERAGEFGISVDVKRVDFKAVMGRMRRLIDADIDAIRRGLTGSENIDYYNAPAEFVAPYTMKVDGKTIRGKMFLLGAGSKTVIPQVEGLEAAGYMTSDTVVHLTELPESLAVIGAGYIAAEYGHFFASMGCKVTIIGRNPQFIADEEPEVSALAKRELGRRIKILTNHEVTKVQGKKGGGGKVLTARDRESGRMVNIEAAEVLVAAGRGPTTEILRPERAGIKTDEKGWLVVDEYLETSQPNVWALGDATGRHLFKHKANYDSQVVYLNAVLKRKVVADYHAVPRAIFTDPEIAAVGVGEAEAVRMKGTKKVVVGFYRYEDTAKGEAMNSHDYFVKIIADRETSEILGAHVVGPYASVLIQEIVAAMYTKTRSAKSIYEAMHIHPALSEVVERAAGSMVPVEHYHHMLKEYGLEAR
jgi:mycothione reductase